MSDAVDSDFPLRVELGSRAYDIHVARGLAERVRASVDAFRAAGRPVAVITDENVRAARSDWMQEVFGESPVLALPAGEGTKCFEMLQRCCDFLASVRIDRSGVLFACGGGVIGDLAGFAAAGFLRGIEFVQVPTTLLAMVDSSVGGKTGINIAAGKNLVGAFHQPVAVFADVDNLSTLPPREFSAGMAEVIKHGMLADAELFETLENLDSPLSPAHPEMAAIVSRNCAIKAAVVRADETETAESGGRALLNLGHTFGHAIEAVTGYKAYLHGEAVAIGLSLATRLSANMEMIDSSACERVDHLLKTYGLPVRLREPLETDALMEAMAHDKKVRRGSLKLVLLESLGKAVTIRDVDPARIREVWEAK